MKSNTLLKLCFIAFTAFLIAPSVLALTWTTDSQTDFNLGNYQNTAFYSDSVSLKQWSDTEKELPHDQTTDVWGIDMSDNILLMHMNEASGTISDFSGNGNNGLYSGSLYSQSGALNSSLGFNGTNTGVALGDFQDFDDIGTGNFAICAWVKIPNSVSTVPMRIAEQYNGNPPFNGLTFHYRPSDNRLLAWTQNSVACRIETTDYNLDDDEWHHVCFGRKSSSELTLYIDGDVALHQTGKTAGDLNSNHHNFAIGYSPQFGQYLDGNIDEFAVWARSVTDQEISDIYQRQTKKYGGANAGEYLSGIFNSGKNSNWATISWITEIPYGQDLPDNQTAENGAFTEGMDMTGNIGLWHLNETSGAIVDSSGNSNNGTVNGGISYNQTGKFGTALDFNGSNGFIHIPHDNSLNPTDKITLLAWLKWDIDPSLGNSYASIINKFADNHYRLQHNNANENFEFAIRTTPNGDRWVDSTTIPQKDKWYLLVGTYDGADLKIYVNGNLENTASHGGDLVTSISDLNIGRRTANDRFFNGIIDEVAIFDRALSESEIENIYLRGVANINLSVRSCDDSSCSGESWTNLGNNLSSPQSLSVSDNQFMQYKFGFDTDDYDFTAKLNSTSVQYNAPPDTPVHSSPLDASSDNILNPILTSSTYSDPETDTHIDTEWQVDDDADFSSPCWERVSSGAETQTTINATNGTFGNESVGKTKLEYETDYYWQVRYKDNGSNNWSNWSTKTYFTTIPEFYIISYDANGADSGTVPANQNKSYNVNINIRSNTGSLTKANSVFNGWNTAIDGSGTHYAENSNFTVNADTVLYAEWTSGTCPTVDHALTYNSYPTCGASSCALGYYLSNGQCYFAGGKSSSRKTSSGKGHDTYFIEKFGHRTINDINQGGINILAFPFSSFDFSYTFPYHTNKLNGEIMIEDLDFQNGKVKFKIKPQNESFELNEKGLLFVDLDQDGKSDFALFFNALDSGMADLTLLPLSQSLQKETIDNEKDRLPSNGSLLKEPNDPTVFLIENNGKRPFCNEQAFLSRGYKWENIIIRSDLTAYPEGESICYDEKISVPLLTHYLFMGMNDEQVKYLQEYLNRNGYLLAESGPGSPGQETFYFGALTRDALINFQSDNHITPAIGHLGPITRHKINSVR